MGAAHIECAKSKYPAGADLAPKAIEHIKKDYMYMVYHQRSKYQMQKNYHSMMILLISLFMGGLTSFSKYSSIDK